MTALVYALGVLIFVIGVAVSIALHECGHMIPARRFGVKVTQFFVGFGNTVWSFRRGETEYGLKAIPLGGYVKLVGMLPPGKGEDPHELRSTSTGLFSQLAADARDAEREHIGPEDEGRLFYTRPWWQKVIVMAGGPIVNLAIAFVLFATVFMGFGAYEPTTTVNTVSACAIPDTEAGRSCTSADPETPAKKAGLQPGDVITTFDGDPVADWDELSAHIRANGSGEATIGYERDGQARTVDIETTVLARADLDDPDKTVEVGFLGVSPTTEQERQGLGYVFGVMGDSVVGTVHAIIDLPQRMVGVVKAAVGGEREDDGPVSVVGAGRVAGELVTYDDPSWGDRAVRLMTLLASVNLFLGMFNFVPLLPLDGGHIAGALYEAVRRGFARLFRRPDPGYVDVAKMLPVAYAVGAVLMIMSVILIYADIVNPVSIS
ncbi:M50 family metallopeptidase [Aeromicrobium sp. IC_218]|uniref:M50 family metallopeptidase n=1 Tax=Aeromicrobium sp. IC_218 TaxID=2545468 RepID=UPI00103BA64C|nr:M50 family metallopeptidase [Aeromicrobium sp. IC_218]TCJ00280.1 RIP metalloprotease [Aeromicrobium sp. IC_218]